MDIEENIEEVQRTAYKWVCPEDQNEIEAESKKRVKSLAEQHISLKH